LVEEYRQPFCDRLVSRLVNQQIVSHDSFNTDNRLSEDGFEVFLGEYDRFMSEEQSHPVFDYTVSRRQVIRLQSTLLRKRLVGELDEYHPYTPY
jgi:CRISPR-associated protein Cas1